MQEVRGHLDPRPLRHQQHPRPARVVVDPVPHLIHTERPGVLEVRARRVAAELAAKPRVIRPADHLRHLALPQPRPDLQVRSPQPVLQCRHVTAEHLRGALQATPGRLDRRPGPLHVQRQRQRRAVRRRARRAARQQRLVLLLSPSTAASAVLLVVVGDPPAAVGDRRLEDLQPRARRGLRE